MVEKVEELFPDLNTAELRVEFLDEVPQTPAKKVAERKTLVESLPTTLPSKALPLKELDVHPCPVVE